MKKVVWLCCLLLCACGTSSTQTIKDDPSGFHIDVPNTWTELKSDQLQSSQSGWSANPDGIALLNSLRWQRAWARDPRATPLDVFSNRAPASPVLWAMVRELSTTETQALSVNREDALQNVALPISTATAGDGLQKIETTSIQVGFGRGIRQVIGWDFGGVSQTMTVILLVNGEDTVLYLVAGRCVDSCNQAQLQELEQAMASIRLGSSNNA